MTDKIINDLVFRRCELGFVFHNDTRYRDTYPQTYAFNTVEEAARWLVERYNPLCPVTSKVETE